MQLQHRSNPKVPDTLVIESPDASKPRRVPLSPLKSVGNSSPTDERDLRTELRVLSRKYDALVVAKKAAEKKYKDDYRRWKSFKSWLLNKSKHAKALRAQIAEEKLDFADDLHERENSSNQYAPFASSSGLASLPRSMQGDDYGRRPSPTSSSRTLGRARSKPVKAEDERLDNCVGRVARPESYTLKADGKRKAQSPGSEIPAKTESVEGSSRIKEESLSSRDVLGSSTKKRGRYSDVADVEEALNALFEIDTSRNNGLPFQFDEVVRGRKQRHQLEAGDCDCCREYYECLEPLPSRPGLPLWESLPPADEPNLLHRHHRHSSPEVAMHHRQQISRHRHQWSPAKTPPDYWNIGFPTTQEAADINRRAADMHAQKRRRVEEEAG
ncbi:uncharacterized protein FOMMEDRAFT_106370 [Fomitiporia mediterranea MF3/22]|uniref:uncharacterized protein n=1 Tax=Fomitiporia mediterranea (strain MF3/22) TaxID=694068 RepID=UPI0004407316|nr:uncharacterized protein FOMMEDRAFT_106370 [Fomitiporia mediterranea MF3/22]EJD03991.1 hypothetical protein FOMMEDRAFT_106370 [Fomitiporia mediterranea MF3/22]